MHYKKSLVAIFLLASYSLNATSLKEALSEVMVTNPVIKERLANFRQTQQDLQIANSEYLPKLDLVSSVGIASKKLNKIVE
jgi:adhesin transport system outer membrane protein